MVSCSTLVGQIAGVWELERHECGSFEKKIVNIAATAKIGDFDGA